MFLSIYRRNLLNVMARAIVSELKSFECHFAESVILFSFLKRLVKIKTPSLKYMPSRFTQPSAEKVLYIVSSMAS